MITFDEYRRHDGIGLAQKIAAGDFSREEVLQAALARLDAVNPGLNLLAQDLRSHAQAQLKQPISGGVLAGVPLLLKDLLADMQGVATGCASPLLLGIKAQQDSDLTAAYRQAGMVLFGKTTSPEWGLMPYTESVLHGITRNPWHVEHTPGGSSGGAAAAVAAQVVPIAHGGDGGGSIRIPAANCGVFGLKPSRGRVSMGPLLVDAWQGMVCEHVLTRSVRDSAAMLDIAAAAPQTARLYHCPPQATSFLDCLQQPLPRLRIAVTDTPWLSGDVAAPIRAAHADTVALLQSLGHEVTEARPAFADAETLGRAMLVAVAGETAKIKRQLQAALGRKISHRDVEAATWSLIVYGEHISAGEAFWARDVINAQMRIAAQFHQQYDVLCTPVLPRLTPKVGELAPSAKEEKASRIMLGSLKLGFLMKNNPVVDRNSRQSLAYIGFTAPFNITGQPAMSVPLYWHEHLPVGSQFAAAHGREDVLLQLAHKLEQARPWFNRNPDL